MYTVSICSCLFVWWNKWLLDRQPYNNTSRRQHWLFEGSIEYAMWDSISIWPQQWACQEKIKWVMCYEYDKGQGYETYHDQTNRWLYWSIHYPSNPSMICIGQEQSMVFEANESGSFEFPSRERENRRHDEMVPIPVDIRKTTFLNKKSWQGRALVNVT